MSITAANCTFMMTVGTIFPTPQQLQQFAADEIFTVAGIHSSEVVMGVDGVMTAGFVFVPIEQGIMLQADSPSEFLFDSWWATQLQLKDILYANATITFPSLGQKWNMVKGSLTTYQPLPNAKKLLQPRQHGITWQNVIPALI